MPASRSNPRSVLLAALQEGPLPLTGGNFTASLAAAVWMECFDGHERGWKRAYQGVMPTLQRHLCKLIRSRRVQRLEDGRYALRKGRFIWPGSRGLGTVEIRIVGAEKVIADCTEIARRCADIQEYLNAPVSPQSPSENTPQ